LNIRKDGKEMEGFGSSSCGLGELKLIQGADREEKAL